MSGAALARDAGRLAKTCDPAMLATQLWATGHGLVMLVLGGALPRTALDAHAPVMTTALLVAAGDAEQRCRTSVSAGWAAIRPSPASC